MKQHFGRTAAVLAATSAFAFGCSNPEKVTFAPNTPGVQNAFEDTRNYWAAQGVNLGSLSVKTIVDGSFSCPTGAVTTEAVTTDSLSPAMYCADADTILISGNTYAHATNEAAKIGISADAVDSATVGHETGHDIILQAHLPATSNIETETTADCLAGVTVAQTEPQLGEQAERFFASMGDADTHGTGEQRAAAFRNGFEHRDMNACNGALSIMLDVPAPAVATPSS